MADASQSPSRPGSDASLAPPSDGRLSSRASVPPSEPRSRASFDVLDQIDRPARAQMIVALILGLVLVAIPLYLWRRPRAESISVAALGIDAGALPAVTAAPGPLEEKLVLDGAKVLSCGDGKKTPPEQCDHVVELEKGFAAAIEENASCVPREAGGGTMVYVAEVTFKKKSVSLTLPKEGRTLKSAKAAAACEKAVKTRLGSLPLDAMKREHSRYKLAITATYPGSVHP